MPRNRSRVPVREWTDARHVRGFAGERVVLRWLRRSGWRLEAHRFRAGRHDIDLVVRRGNLVAFVEVKTRSGTGLGPPEEAVSWKKRRSQAWCAAVWVARFGRPEDRYRFDVASVLLGPNGPKVRHTEDAWRPV